MESVMNTSEVVRCSFCGDRSDEVDCLVKHEGNLDIAICIECVENYMDILKIQIKHRHNLLFRDEQSRTRMEPASNLHLISPLNQLSFLEKALASHHLKTGNTNQLIRHAMTRRPPGADYLFVIPKPEALAGPMTDNSLNCARMIILDYLGFKWGGHNSITIGQLNRESRSAEGWHVQAKEQRSWYEREIVPEMEAILTKLDIHYSKHSALQEQKMEELGKDEVDKVKLARVEKEIALVSEEINLNLEQIELLEEGDFYVIWGQCGLSPLRSGKSVRLVETTFNINEFGFGLYEHLVNMLVHPKLAWSSRITTACSGDRHHGIYGDWPKLPVTQKKEGEAEMKLSLSLPLAVNDLFAVPTFTVVEL